MHQNRTHPDREEPNSKPTHKFIIFKRSLISKQTKKTLPEKKNMYLN